MKISQTLFVFLFLLLSIASREQINLVMNPSFEDHDSCPDMTDEAKYALHWMSLDTLWTPPDWAHAVFGVPDYLHICGTNPVVTIPATGWAMNRYPRTGKAMMQVNMFANDRCLDRTGIMQSQYRDYLQGHLIRPLSAGKPYKVTFHLRHEMASFYAVNKVSAYFDNGTIDTTRYPGRIQAHIHPQVIDTSIKSDTSNWMKVEGVFTANGSERLITIGHFTHFDSTNYITLHDTTLFGPCGAWYSSYYLVDDVSVIDCDNVPFAGHDTVLMHVGDSAFIGPHEVALPYTWYVLGSTTPIDSGGGIWVHPAVTTTYVLLQKLCGQDKMDTVTVHVWPDTVLASPQPHLREKEVACWPNPASGLLTVENVDGLSVSLCNLVGQSLEVRKASPRERTLTFDMSSLPNGIYFIIATDPETGQKVVRKVVRE